MNSYIKSIRIFCATILIASAFAADAAEGKSPFAVNAGIAPNIGEVKLTAERNWLLLPMKSNADYSKIRLLDRANGTCLGEYDTLLTSDKPDWFAELDISQFKGRELSLLFEKKGLGAPKIMQSDTIPERNFRRDRGRPIWALTAKHGWFGAPHALVKFGGMWHAFFDYNPFTMTPRQNIYWGHAVSSDLVNWNYAPIAFAPRMLDGKIDAPISGGAYLDTQNESGLFPSNAGGVVFVVTRSQSGDSIVVSQDLKNFGDTLFKGVIGARGKSLSIFRNRDAKLWNILRLEPRGKGDNIENVVAIYASENLREWEKTDEIRGYFENGAQLVKMPVVGAPDTPKWVLFGSEGKFIVGDFDGRKFSAISAGSKHIFYGDARDAKIWQNADDNRVLASARVEQNGDFVRDLGQKFSQSLGLPWEIILVKALGGEYQLRAHLPQEIWNHLSFPRNALGVANIEFSSNTFTLPDAYGNKFMIAGKVDISLATSVNICAGTAYFRFDKTNARVSTARLLEPHSLDYLQARHDSDDLEFKVFVDTYGVELSLGAGEAVLYLGDPFLNPEQEIKLGAIGTISTINLTRFDMLRFSQKQRYEMAEKEVKDIESGKRKLPTIKFKN